MTGNGNGAQSPSALFIVVSFEGPDPYSQAGGLGVRITGLVNTLAGLGYETRLFFIGDPVLPGEERLHSGRLVLHRWAQWVSGYHPGGVYDGEYDKVNEVSASLPGYIVDRVIKPALAADRPVIVLLEEWQTAETACRVSDLLHAAGVRDRVVIAWNANNSYGFEGIDWGRLAASTIITTISRHMRSIIRANGADALVIPNGIPQTSLAPVAPRDLAAMRAALGDPRRAAVMFKMARWEREKGWSQALDAVLQLRTGARPPVLIARSGGPTGDGGGLAPEAERRGLRVVSFDKEHAFIAGLGASVRAGAEVIHLRFGVSPQLARTLFTIADGVLANSVSEPFGLVALEAMAVGGVVYTGGTGEDYAIGGLNAVVLETLDPSEIVSYWTELASSPERVAKLRRAARETARRFEWRMVAGVLIGKLARLARRDGVLAAAG